MVRKRLSHISEANINMKKNAQNALLPLPPSKTANSFGWSAKITINADGIGLPTPVLSVNTFKPLVVITVNLKINKNEIISDNRTNICYVCTESQKFSSKQITFAFWNHGDCEVDRSRCDSIKTEHACLTHRNEVTWTICFDNVLTAFHQFYFLISKIKEIIFNLWENRWFWQF